jgi:pimeloyl-ACP methyl ester carboxylesterase
MISDKVGMRELITLDGNGVLVRGTYHRVGGQPEIEASDSNRNVGLMFLNALFHPRAANADSAVYWADSFAESGYPTFRLDLPGLGDSYGVIPNDLLRFINDGGYSSITCSKAKELVHSFGLSGTVMFGHCAGATTAIYAASESKECKGLILLDPYFNLPKALTSKLRPELVHWARRSKLGALLRATYDRIREAPGAFRRDALPANANHGFVSRWRKVVSNGVPILILRSPEPAALGSSKLRAGNFDYLGYILSFAVSSNQVTIRTIEDTDHSFANRAGRAAVRQNVETWLREYFPQAFAEKPVLEEQGFLIQEMINPLTVSGPVPVHVSLGD